MRLTATLGVLCLLLSTCPSPLSAAPLQPIDNWHLDYGDTQCTAAKSFGDPTTPVVLGIVPSIGGENYELVINVQHSGPRFAQEFEGTVDFGRGKIKTWLLFYGAKGAKVSDYQFRVPADEFEQARSATAISLTGNGQQFSFSLTEMPALMDALRKCTADLQQYWNAGEQHTGSPSKGDVRSLFTADDYPSEALMRTQGGTSQFRVLVDEKGNVAGCDVFRQSHIPVFDVMGCQVIKERAKFAPAVDAHGKTVRSVVITPPVTWMVDDLPQLDDTTLTGRPVGQKETKD